MMAWGWGCITPHGHADKSFVSSDIILVAGHLRGVPDGCLKVTCIRVAKGDLFKADLISDCRYRQQ